VAATAPASPLQIRGVHHVRGRQARDVGEPAESPQPRGVGGPLPPGQRPGEGPRLDRYEALDEECWPRSQQLPVEGCRQWYGYFQLVKEMANPSPLVHDNFRTVLIGRW
jgi:hypothetical protein